MDEWIPLWLAANTPIHIGGSLSTQRYLHCIATDFDFTGLDFPRLDSAGTTVADRTVRQVRENSSGFV